MNLALRVRGGLIAVALLLVAGTAWRAGSLADSAAPEARAVALPVNLGGGALVRPHGDALRIERRRGSTVVLRRGQQLALGEATLRFEDVGARGVEILRRPARAFAGFRRIDAGADPLGRADGVRDRIVVPGEGGWFFLLPTGGEEARFGPEDRSALLVAERPLLLTRGDELLDVPAGTRLPVEDAFSVAVDDLRLDVAWESAVRAEPVLDGAGKVLGYKDAPTVELVVRSVEAAEVRPRLRVVDAGGVELFATAPGAPLLLHGDGDRLGPLRRGVLPSRAAHRQLEDAVADGLRDGWISVGRERSAVAVPPDGEDPAHGWPLARSVVDLVDRYDHARLPVAVRPLSGLVPARGTCTDSLGATTSLRHDDPLDAWVPGPRPLAGGVHTCTIPVRPGAEVEVALGLPAAWKTDGDWVALPVQAGTWAPHVLDVGEATEVTLRLDARRPAPGPDRITAAIAGAPAGTRLGALAVGARAYGGWDRSGADDAALAVLDAVPGDRWRAEGEAPSAKADRERDVFLRVPVSAATSGGLALDLTVPGALVSARWDGQPVSGDAVTRLAEGARVSLPLGPGEHLLALHTRRPAEAPAAEAGGARFAVDADGRPRALAARVADRRAKAAVLADVEPGRLLDRDGRDAPTLVVERGVPGLPAGTRWRLAPGREAGDALLVLASGLGPVVASSLGQLDLRDDGLSWANGAVPLAVARRVETDPDGPPLAGFRVGARQRQPLSAEGTAIIGPGFRLESDPDCGLASGTLRASLAVLRAGRATCLEVSGAPRWSTPEDPLAGTRLRLRVADGAVAVATTRPGTLWSEDGTSTPVAASPEAEGFVPWPEGARLVLHGSPLRLRRPARDELAPMLAAAPVPRPAQGERILSLDDDLQADALAVLDRHLAGLRSDDGPADTHALRGVVYALDAGTGQILACAGRTATGAVTASACWEDHDLRPGSTWKPLVAAAALGSSDPTVQRMLRGDLPAGLRRAAPSGSLADARLPDLSGADDRALRTRLRNFKGAATPLDRPLADALRASDNVWFGYLGLLLHRPLRAGWGDAAIASRAGREEAWPVLRLARAAGLGRDLDLGFGVQGTGGRLPALAADSDAAIAARSVGQDAVRATPLAIGAVLAAVATDGSAPDPTLDPTRSPSFTALLAPSDARTLRDALRSVVREGTAARAFSDHPVRDLLIGKTGSSQRVDGHGLPRTDSWFAGAVLPPDGADGAPVVLVAVLPGAGLGGRHAAEVVDQLSRRIIEARGWDREESVTWRW